MNQPNQPTEKKLGLKKRTETKYPNIAQTSVG